MLSIWMILAAATVQGFSGLPACLLSSRSVAGQHVTTLLMLIGSALGFTGLALLLGESVTPTFRTAWFLPWGEFAVAVDPISVLFLVPVFVVPVLGSFYGLGYWKTPEHPDNGCRLGLFYGLLAGSMALVAVARDGVLFLFAWEVMALAAYFAATVEEDNVEARRAGWVYLIATHMGTLCLIAMFSLWRLATSSFALEPATAELAMSAGEAGTIFVLSMVGFGFKAGLMPLHVWLPGAHANAPSHVSAVMSGVMLKMGIYGMVRMTSLLPSGAGWWGGVMLAVGVITGVAGIVFAVGQHDLKRLLAYSSIENIGIIAMGLGLALLGRSQNRADWVALGLGASLYHVLNHSLFKSLLFLNAGAIIHVGHTRDIDRLGGLAQRMPRTMVLFVVGAVAICALPPLNGFVSEWLLYVGLFHTLDMHGEAGLPVVAVAAVALAMIGALAVACFVKLLGMVFLGTARSEVAEQAHDPSVSMMIPMVVLAVGCACLGLFPMVVLPMLQDAVQTWALFADAPGTLAAVATVRWITVMGLGLGLVALTVAIVLALKVPARSSAITGSGTWDCGYARPTSRMQYTGTSISQVLVDLFSFVLWPRKVWPVIRGLFPQAESFKSTVPDTVLDRLVLPVFCLAGRYLPRLRVLQQGRTHLYILYILIVVLVLFAWGTMEVQP